MLQASAVESRESLRDRVARLEAIIQASSDSVAVDQTSNLSQVDTQSAGIRTQFSSPLGVSNTTASSFNAFNSIDKECSQDIDPIVTLFGNAIVSFIVPLSSRVLRPYIVETT